MQNTYAITAIIALHCDYANYCNYYAKYTKILAFPSISTFHLDSGGLAKVSHDTVHTAS